MQVERSAFYSPREIFNSVQYRISKAMEVGETIDYLTFVPDGEPTLDINLGKEIELLKPLGVKMAVITNDSLIWRKDVRDDLMKADWVSLKVDSTREEVWHKIDRPYGTLQLSSILDGMLKFAKDYKGELVTETMLIKDLNDRDDLIMEVAEYLAKLRPSIAYLSIPTRPPAEEWAQPPGEDATNRIFQILSERIDHVELLIGYEGNTFAFTGDAEEDLLSITSVHPMREEAVREYLAQAGSDWYIVRELIDRGKLIETSFGGRKFYMRKFIRESL